MSPAALARWSGRLLRRVRADTRGQSLVEFAFVVPMLVIMLVGMVDFAKLWMQYQMITDAAREAARQAVIFKEGGDQDAINSDIVSGISTAMARAGVTATPQTFTGCQAVGTTTSNYVEIYECGWDGSRGDPATVTIRAPYEFGLLGRFIQVVTGDSKIMLTTSITMRNE